jgi:hypothetical protein
MNIKYDGFTAKVEVEDLSEKEKVINKSNKVKRKIGDKKLVI